MIDSGSDFEFGAMTDAGRKRRGEPNQDSIRVLAADPANGRAPLLIIADGMGGYEGGAIASQIVVETILSFYQNAAENNDILFMLTESVRLAHEAIKLRANQDVNLSSMGSTVVMIVLTETRVYCANVGDSRAYILNAHAIKQISEDQSIVGEQVRAGLLTPLQALRNPKRNRLTQSITARRKDIHPYVNQVEWAKEDVLLVCTDGLWGVVSEAIVRAVAWELLPQQAAEKLVELVKSSGAPDNVSVILARRKGVERHSAFKGDETGPG